MPISKRRLARRAGGPHPRREGILGPAVHAQRRDPRTAAGDGDAGRGGACGSAARLAGRRSRSAISGPGCGAIVDRAADGTSGGDGRSPTDISERGAGRGARECGAARRRWRESDFVRPAFAEAPQEAFDVVVVATRPISGATISRRLQPEVRDHDPRVALDGGPDGLAAYRAILGRVGALLKQGGLLALRGRARPGRSVAALCRRRGLRDVAIEAAILPGSRGS